ALTAFIPMLMGTGGNAGGQVSVTVIRGLSLGEIRMGDVLRILWKELRVALLAGGTLAAVNFCKMLAFDNVTMLVAAVVSVTVFTVVILAKLVGGLMPILAKRVGCDPAVMANPFITTIVDVMSLLVYFGMAKLLLGL
ncbi:MAG: magnesium transporter, partial [Clostridia bacterium]|nr:magnesium transporter [Clostridia bacterium]